MKKGSPYDLKLILIVSIFLTAILPSGVSTINQGVDFNPPNNSKVLILVAGGVGITYYHAKDKFESWGWDVDTAGVSSSVVSCPRQNPQVIDAEFLISEVSLTKLQEYDCIFIPSGGHWDGLSSYQPTLDLIFRAYHSGLIISSLCIGIVVLARANIIDGIRIANSPNSITYVEEAGGIMVEDTVVTDKRIVTGGTGGGLYGGGASVAPTNETCEAIAIAINDYNIGFIITTSITGIILTGFAVFFILAKYLKKRKRI
jgi:putative intracellular protease/amidase